MKTKKSTSLFTEENKRAFEKIIASLFVWDSVEDQDPDWGHIILASRNIPTLGETLRRIKPVRIEDGKYTIDMAKNLQRRLQKDLVEVWPYRVGWDNQRHTMVEILRPLFVLGD